jgi:hypothetical protein
MPRSVPKGEAGGSPRHMVRLETRVTSVDIARQPTLCRKTLSVEPLQPLRSLIAVRLRVSRETARPPADRPRRDRKPPGSRFPCQPHPKARGPGGDGRPAFLISTSGICAELPNPSSRPMHRENRRRSTHQRSPRSRTGTVGFQAGSGAVAAVAEDAGRKAGGPCQSPSSTVGAPLHDSPMAPHAP